MPAGASICGTGIAIIGLSRPAYCVHGDGSSGPESEARDGVAQTLECRPGDLRPTEIQSLELIQALEVLQPTIGDSRAEER